MIYLFFEKINGFSDFANRVQALVLKRIGDSLLLLRVTRMFPGVRAERQRPPQDAI
jgi:hypothetical protein